MRRSPQRVGHSLALAAVRKAQSAVWVECLRGQLATLGIKAPALVAEHQGIPGRKFSFDLALPAPEMKIAIEVEGGVFARRPGQGSRHTSMTGYAADCEKYNLAAIHGWLVLRFTTGPMIRSWQAANWVRDAIAARKAAGGNVQLG